MMLFYGIAQTVNIIWLSFLFLLASVTALGVRLWGYTLVVVNPARVVGWMCRSGMKSDFRKNIAKCSRCKRIFEKISDSIFCKNEIGRPLESCLGKYSKRWPTQQSYMNTMDEKRTLLFVLGAPKTGTSTLVGILNSSPHVFLLYEAFLIKEKLKKGGKRKRVDLFLNRYPELGHIFEGNNREGYVQLADYFRHFKYVGDKLPGFIDLMPFVGHKIIFAIRDLRSWLCKDKVLRNYYVNNELVTTAVEYVAYFLNAIKAFEDLCIIRMEDLINHNSKVLNELPAFLDLEGKSFKEWWTKVGNYKEDDPKAYWPWWGTHPSSLVEPKELDVKVSLRGSQFWNEILQVFDKYYLGVYEKDEIDEDLLILSSLRKYRLGIDDLYYSFENIRIVQDQDNRSMY